MVASLRSLGEEIDRSLGEQTELGGHLTGALMGPAGTTPDLFQACHGPRPIFEMCRYS